MLNWTDIHVPLGGIGGITVIATGPVPVTTLELDLNGQPAITIAGSDLRQQWTIPWAVTPGTTRVNVSAQDGRGCTDRTGLLRQIFVP